MSQVLMLSKQFIVTLVMTLMVFLGSICKSVTNYHKSEYNGIAIEMIKSLEVWELLQPSNLCWFCGANGMMFAMVC